MKFMMKEKEINDANMTEDQIKEKLLKLTTGDDNVQSVVEDSSNNVEKEIEENEETENVDSLENENVDSLENENVDSQDSTDSPKKEDEIIIWNDFVLDDNDELNFAEKEFKHNKENNFTDKQAIERTKTAIKTQRKNKAKKLKEEKEKEKAIAKAKAEKLREDKKKEKEEKAIAKENEKRFKELEETKAINYRIQHYENLGLEVNKNGFPTQNAGNYKALLLNKDVVPHTFKFNEFSESIEIDGRLLKDIDTVFISNLFSDIAGFENNTKIQNAIKEIAYNNSYHPVKQYLESLEWDGVPRVETMFTTFLSAKDCELYHVYAKLFMIAAIKRVYKPGCKFDNMLVLQGEQGNGKSTFCEKLAVNDKWYNDNIIIADRDKDSLLYMQDAWIVIMDELDAWNKADSNAAKGFMSKRSDKFRAPYAQNSEEHPRHCVFIGNTNDETFLKDSTAITERRYWVIKTEGNWETSRDKIKLMTPEMINQLWAEAMVMYKENEDIELVIPPELYKDMVNEQLQFKNENGCEQYDFLEDILNKEYSPTVFDNLNNLYNEYENKVIIEDKSILKKMDYFPISSLKFLFQKEKWIRKKNTFTMFAKWSQSSIWNGSKWESKVISRNNRKFGALVRIDNSDNKNSNGDNSEKNHDNKNKFIRFTGDNDDPYKFINDDIKTKITGLDEFI